jgi:hypothetical protein
MSKPWITGAIRFSLNVKNKLYKRYITTRTSYSHTKFKIYRNKLKRLIYKQARNSIIVNTLGLIREV